MSQETVNVKASAGVVVKLTFEGVAAYAAQVFEATDPSFTQFHLVRTLEDQGESHDARPDEFHFDPPAAGKKHLFFLQANISHPVANSKVSVKAEVFQNGQSHGFAKESGEITTGFLPIVVRIVLVGVA